MNRMPYTNPGGISNSGGSSFINQKSKILKLNMNLIENGDAFLNYFNSLQSSQISNVNTNTTIPENDFKLILQEQRNSNKINRLTKTNFQF